MEARLIGPRELRNSTTVNKGLKWLEKGPKCLKHKRSQTSGTFGLKDICIFISNSRNWNRNSSLRKVE